jgi:pSer/pThr/pTyr-binding forkhead associated (FHA) protein
MDETVKNSSNLGKRLEKIPNNENRCILFNGKKISMTAKITIGRGEGNDIILDDTMASRSHAVVQKIKEDFYLKDIGSTNGTFVNDTPVPKDKYIKLTKNDIISIGRTKLNIL